MIKAVIIDDETPARNNLKQILKDNFKDIEIIGEADSVQSGVIILNQLIPDLVFLDINLSDGVGFNILEQIQEINFKIIFVTAYDNFAIKAFQFNALDYILKPIEIKYLEEAIQKTRSLYQQNQLTKENLKIVLENYGNKTEDKKLPIHERDKVSFVAIKDITRCSADGNYTTFHFSNGETKVVSKTLKTIELQLPETLFYRVHHSVIINLNYVKEYNKEDGGYVVLNDNTNISVSRRKKDDFFKLMEQKFS